MADIIFDNISFRYENGFRAVQNLNFKIESSTIHGFYGESSSSKTTIADLISGFRVPFNGNIKFNNEIVNNLKPADRKISIISNDPALFSSVSVIKNIMFPVRDYKHNRVKYDTKMEFLIKVLKLNDIIKSPVEKLNYFSSQKISLARAVIKDCNLIILDEPLLGMDLKCRDIFLSSVAAIQEKFNLTIVYFSREINSLLKICNGISFLEKGNIYKYGKVNDIINNIDNFQVLKIIYGQSLSIFNAIVKKKDNRLMFHTLENINYVFSQQRSERLFRAGSKNLIIALRSDKIKLKSNADSAAGIKAKIEKIENYPDFRIVYCKNRFNEYKVKIGFLKEYTVGESVELIPDFKDCLYFDKDDEYRIYM